MVHRRFPNAVISCVFFKQQLRSVALILEPKIPAKEFGIQIFQMSTSLPSFFAAPQRQLPVKVQTLASTEDKQYSMPRSIMLTTAAGVGLMPTARSARRIWGDAQTQLLIRVVQQCSAKSVLKRKPTIKLRQNIPEVCRTAQRHNVTPSLHFLSSFYAEDNETRENCRTDVQILHTRCRGGRSIVRSLVDGSIGLPPLHRRTTNARGLRQSFPWPCPSQA